MGRAGRRPRTWWPSRWRWRRAPRHEPAIAIDEPAHTPSQPTHAQPANTRSSNADSSNSQPAHGNASRAQPPLGTHEPAASNGTRHATGLAVGTALWASHAARTGTAVHGTALARTTRRLSQSGSACGKTRIPHHPARKSSGRLPAEPSFDATHCSRRSPRCAAVTGRPPHHATGSCQPAFATRPGRPSRDPPPGATSTRSSASGRAPPRATPAGAASSGDPASGTAPAGSTAPGTAATRGAAPGLASTGTASARLPPARVSPSTSGIPAHLRPWLLESTGLALSLGSRQSQLVEVGNRRGGDGLVCEWF